MWAFLSARLRWWLILAVGAPLLAWALGRLGDLLESRYGPSVWSRVLRAGRDWLRQRSRGPLARRRPGDPTGVRDAGPLTPRHG